MSPYAKTILCDLGLFLHVPGVMALISLIVSLCYREYYALFPFLVTAIASLYHFAKEVIEMVAPEPLCSLGFGVSNNFVTK